VSRFDDHDDEMARRELDDDAVEALLAGRSAPPGWGAVGAFVVEARSAGRGEPPAPSSELRAILAAGLSPASEADAAHAPGARGDRAVGSTVPVRRSRRMAVAELVAGLGLGAKVLLGAGVASASLTAAGAAGVLPGPVDHAVEGVVRTATPFDISDDDPNDDGNFGSIVSEDATDPSSPGVDGQTISSMAHDRHADATTTTVAPTTTTTSTTTDGSTTTTATTDATTDTSATNQGLGDTVSADARGEDGTNGVDGQTVASEARQHGRDHNSTTTTASTEASTTTTSTTAAADDTEADTGPGASGTAPGATAPGRDNH
jgi:hypothetical protein